MYSGTPDSAWFVRGGAGQRLEFTDGEIVLVAEVDSGTSRPVIHLSVVPLDPNQVHRRFEMLKMFSPLVSSFVTELTMFRWRVGWRRGWRG